MNRTLQGCCWLGVCLVMCVFCPLLAAQEPDKPADPGDDFWLNRDFVRAASAAQVIGIGEQPFGALVLRAAGLQKVVWDEVGFAETFAPELNPAILRDIKDRRWMPNMRDRPKNEIPPEDWAIYKAFSAALVTSFDVPLEAFRKSAEENRSVTFGHMMANPNLYRGKVVSVKGKMKMLRREEPPLLAKEGGVKDLYIGWVFGETRNATPFCIQFPILPKGLEPKENMERDVTFYGYFLATFKYEGGRNRDGTPTILVTPLLVGPTVIVDNKAATKVEHETPMALVILGLAVSFLAFLSVVFFMMYYWLQRGDQKVLTTLDQIKQKHMGASFTNEGDLPPLGSVGTPSNPASSQLIVNGQPPGRLPEARPIDPERN